MTRDAAKNFLSSLGIEPTDEQISAYLNQIGGELKKEKDRADGYKKDAERASELQAQIDAINAQNMSDVEKANAETQKANDQIASLQKELARLKLAKNLSDSGIVGDDATSILEAMDGGDMTAMVTSFGKIISARETAAASAKEQELLKKTPTPGGSGSGSADGKTSAEKIVEGLYAGDKAKEGTPSVLSFYTNN